MSIGIRTRGAVDAIALPHFGNYLGYCFIKLPAAIKANL